MPIPLHKRKAIEDILTTVLSMCQYLLVRRTRASSLAYGITIQRCWSRVCRKGKI